MMPRFIYLTGADGTGKSTYAQFIVQTLQGLGIRPIHRWLRYPFIFSLPFLVYARIKGFSKYENQNNFYQGYWYFKNSVIMHLIFPWVYLLDGAIASIRFIYIPLLLGKTIVCERFLIDMVVDLMIATEDDCFHKKLPGILFFKLLPSEGKILVLDLDMPTIIQRRPELRNDKRLGDRLNAYHIISTDYQIDQLATHHSLAEVMNKIEQWLIGECK